MFFEFMQHLLALDFGWIISLAGNNLFLVFILFTLIYIFFEGKKVLFGFLLLVFLLWITLDFENSTGMFWAIGEFMALLYISRLAISIWVENTPSLKNSLIAINAIFFFIALFIYYGFLK
ncbi:MAG: hypothetical protein V1494_00045 [Candidatus Diapherotrites archaeon]